MNIETNSDNAKNGNGESWQVLAGVKNEDKRQVVAKLIAQHQVGLNNRYMPFVGACEYQIGYH